MSGGRKAGTLLAISLRWPVWILIFVMLLSAIAVSIVIYVRDADSGYRSGALTASRIAVDQGGLAEVTQVDLHTWESTVWIAAGTDEAGGLWMIWELPDRLVKLKVSEHWSREMIAGKFAGDHGDDAVIRLMPGWFEDRPVWEIRYWENPDAKQFQAIDFYSFEDGSLLQTYRLAS